MPTYDYRAVEPDKAAECCSEGFEIVQPMSEAPLEKCPMCQAPITKIIGAPGFTLKSEKHTMSDKNLKRAGFKKLVKEGDGKYRNVLA
ncbi:MAG: FmdB family zinc ribbon protein [Planctomycetota bacterium]